MIFCDFLGFGGIIGGVIGFNWRCSCRSNSKRRNKKIIEDVVLLIICEFLLLWKVIGGINVDFVFVLIGKEEGENLVCIMGMCLWFLKGNFVFLKMIFLFRNVVFVLRL